MKRIFPLSLVAVTVFLGALISTGSYGQEELTKIDADEAFAEGVALFEEGSFAEAISRFDLAAQVDNTNIDALVYKGLALNELEAYDSAVQVFKQAIDLRAGAVAYNGRGEALLELGQYDLATSDFNTAGELDRTNPKVLSNIGHMKVLNFEDPEAALRFLQDATDLNPEDARAFRDLGVAHARLSEFEEAVASLNQASEIEPENYENYSTLASVYLAQEEYEAAVDALTQAIEAYEPQRRTDPDLFLDGYNARADARLRLGNDAIESDKARSTAAYEAVITDVNAILSDYEDRPRESGPAFYRKGLAQRMLGRYGEAIESLTEAIQNVTQSTGGYLADAYLRRGICWHNQGYEDLARKDFERAIGVNFESPLPHFWIGLTFATEGDYREAINHYSDAVAKRDNYALAFVNRGLSYYKLEDYEKAIDNFNEAIMHEPLEAAHYYKRGVAHMRLEQYEKAVTSFADALRKDPDLAQAKREMAKAQQALGNSTLAPLYQDDAR